MQHLISIVMPAYNAGKYIAEAIASVQAQTYADWELIVVNDGSNDDTPQVVAALAEKDKRISLFEQPNGGQAAARNTALRHSRGDLIAFLDSDDLWIPGKLAAQVEVSDKATVDFVFCQGYVFSASEPKRESIEFAHPSGEVAGDEMFRRLFAANTIASPSPLVKRSALDRAGLFDESRRYQNCEDYDMWLRVARSGARFYSMPDRLFMYRRHETASTHETSRVLRPMIAVLLKHADISLLHPHEIEPRIRSVYRNLIIALVQENKLDEAQSTMKEFVAWDKRRIVTRSQELLLRWWPRRFSFISRECLFRLEWHLSRITRRLST